MLNKPAVFNCLNSPSLIFWTARDCTSNKVYSLFSSAINNPLDSKKSPKSIAALLFQMLWMLTKPLLECALSTTSSWSKVAV